MTERELKAEIDALAGEVQGLNSKFDLALQKLKLSEKNEEVIGRTLIMINSKIKKFEEQGSSVSQPVAAAAVPSPEVGDLKKRVDELYRQVQELKYVLNQINPLEFVSLADLRDIMRKERESWEKSKGQP